MLTNKQLINIIISIFSEDDINNYHHILTNSSRVAAVLLSIGFNQKQIYISACEVNDATKIYNNGIGDDIPIDNIYLAEIENVAQNFKRTFDCMIFSVDDISYDHLEIISNTIKHGAKDGCLVCTITSSNTEDEQISQKIDSLVNDMAEVYSDPLTNEKKDLYVNKICMPIVAVPWHKENIKAIRASIKEELKRVSHLLAPTENSEIPYIGAKNHAFLLFITNYFSITCVQTGNFQIPIGYYYINNNLFSHAVAYLSKTYRNVTSAGQNGYMNNCAKKALKKPPYVCPLVNDEPPRQVENDDFLTAFSPRKSLVVDLLINDNSEVMSKLRSIFSKWNISDDTITALMKGVATWVKNNGGIDKVSDSKLLEHLKKYPEFDEFVKSMQSDGDT